MIKAKEKEKHISAVREFLAESDKDGDGIMEFEELQELLHRQDIQKMLHHVGIGREEIEGLFSVLVNSDGVCSHEELIGGIIRVTGGARAIDSVMILHTQSRVASQIKDISNTVEAISKVLLRK